MTLRQTLMKLFYPLIMKFSAKSEDKGKIIFSTDKQKPPVSFYELHAFTNSNQPFDFQKLKGKKILLVNTASNCGYTGQFDELQALQNNYPNQLLVVGFPANDFKEQEKGSDEDIAQFCRLNYGVSFPLMQKSVVVKNPEQNSVFQWLTHSEQNGWNDHQPDWNFSKYLIDENGNLMAYFGPAVSPLSKDIIHLLTQ